MITYSSSWTLTIICYKSLIVTPPTIPHSHSMPRVSNPNLNIKEASLLDSYHNPKTRYSLSCRKDVVVVNNRIETLNPCSWVNNITSAKLGKHSNVNNVSTKSICKSSSSHRVLIRSWMRLNWIQASIQTINQLCNSCKLNNSSATNKRINTIWAWSRTSWWRASRHRWKHSNATSSGVKSSSNIRLPLNTRRMWRGWSMSKPSSTSRCSYSRRRWTSGSRRPVDRSGVSSGSERKKPHSCRRPIKIYDKRNIHF